MAHLLSLFYPYLLPILSYLLLTCYTDIFIPVSGNFCLRTFAFAVSSACIGFSYISEWFLLSFSTYSFLKIQTGSCLDHPVKNCNFFDTTYLLCIFSYSLLVSNILYILLAYLVCFLSSLEYEVFEGRVFCFILVLVLVFGLFCFSFPCLWLFVPRA